MRKTLSIALVLMVAFATSAFARSVDNTDALERLHQMDVNAPVTPPQGGVVGAAAPQVDVYYGGTELDDGRLEATYGTWTFDTGFASSFSSTVLGGLAITSGLVSPHSIVLNPFKDSSRHTIMEGWIGFDNSFGLQTEFRRVSTTGQVDADGNGSAEFTDPWEEGNGQACVGAPYIAGAGTWSMYCGKLPDEGRAACYADTGGYGDSWNLCIQLTSLSVDGTANNVTWNFDYKGDTEPGFDYSYAIVDTNGVNPGGESVVQTNTGGVAGSASLSLVRGVDMRGDAGSVYFLFCVVADGAYSDQDGLDPTTCGAFTVDNVSITGGSINYGPEGFEGGDGGWELAPPTAGAGGEWSDIAAIVDLPATKTNCECRMVDSVLVFDDPGAAEGGGHGTYQDNLVASPVLDLLEDGNVGAPGKDFLFDGYFELTLPNYIFVQTNVRWYPYVCPVTAGIIEGPWVSDGFVRYFGGVPTCTTPDVLPVTIPFGSRVDAGAEQMQIALGMINYCRFYAATCTGFTNSTPWFDNVQFHVYGTPGAPLIATRTVDYALDAFPQNNSLDPTEPGRMDENNVKGFTDPEPNSSLGDTMTVTGGNSSNGGTWVEVVFNVRPGDGNVAAINAWAASHATVGAGELGATRAALGTWYSARMDTAEQGGTQTAIRSWMTAYHESATGDGGAALFAGANDGVRDLTDLDALGEPNRLLNDIFPDDLFTPGTRVNYFYRARYVNSPGVWFNLPAADVAYEFGNQEDTPGYFEFEVLPSSTEWDPQSGDPGTATWNCVLYVDHFDGRGGQIPIEDGLANVMPGGSGNAENVRWDRYDVEAPSSQQASLGRPSSTQYGATLTHLLAYQGMVWNSGNLPAFNLSKEDADQLDPWLTIGPTIDEALYNKIYISGDGSAQSAFEDTDPAAREFLNELCGVDLRCATYRDPCDPREVADEIACVDIDPIDIAGTPSENRPENSVVAEGNGCPQLRSFDILSKVNVTRYGALPVEDEAYSAPSSGEFASIVLDQPDPDEGATYSTVVDGVSVHYRREADCVAVPPIEGRLDEVLSWLGLTTANSCDNPAQLVSVPDSRPAFKTALSNFAPNPLFSGATGTIQFTMAKEGKASVDIFDVNGRLVRTVFDGSAKEGVNVVHWNGKDTTDRQVASGVYFTRFRANGEEFAKKMVVVAGNGN
jgi:hypothetical protein